ncbi:hypothetical protein EDB89DRAFT_111048 [Lactarius sanguifluus]|nr:hypothetical protein EDB89DRAFT_111048 [Lactarius sanguifluus]
MTLITKLRSSSMRRANYGAYPGPSHNLNCLADRSLGSSPVMRPISNLKSGRRTHVHISSHPRSRLSIRSNDPRQSRPPPPDMNSLAGLPLTTLPESALTVIVIPAHALGHLHARLVLQIQCAKCNRCNSMGSGRVFAMGGAVSVHDLLASLSEPTPTPAMDSGTCATTTTNSATAAATITICRTPVWISPRPQYLYTRGRARVCSWNRRR